ncbi:FAD-binding and (Fe-S)-binding domain-containing protein [Azospirillum halopraeferens]|uniref:FAD-binding and (Fe-S)-binding domain-containing protein n=1 Tax=Azospirillum halopraeferens TaxID=34010 RepID=UPI0003F78C73|nr:FAD-binding and (Fe-S)-binding domain-containing protein [Azospirillum halopraeferens]
MPDSIARHVDVDALAADLRREVDGDVRFDAGHRALYATDASNYRQVPIGLVVPRHVEAIRDAVAVCARHGAPIVHRGGGTALAGQSCNTAVVIDGSRHCHRIVELDPENRRATVEPGCVLDDLRHAARAHGLTFGPDPATHDHCTLGGMIGNNSGGVHAVMAGLTIDNVESLDVLTYDGLRLTVGPTPDRELERIIAAGGRRGEIYAGLRALRDAHADEIRRRFPDIPRPVSGYPLDQLLPENGFNVARALVGTEGTCVTILHATVRLVPEPPHRVLLAVGFDDIACAADFVPRLLEHGPIGLEGIDERLVQNMRRKCLHPDEVKRLPDGENWLLVEFGGTSTEEARERARRLEDDLAGNRHVRGVAVHARPEDQAALWRVREAGLGATAFAPGAKRDTWEGWEDSAVRREDLGDYIRDLKALYARHDLHGAMYGHFGDGLIHTRIDFGLHSEEDLRRFRRFLEEAAELVTRYGGSLSGEHGDGIARGELLPIMYGERIVRAFEAFKAIWDPANRMNPGRIVHPYPLDSHLRLGTRYRPPQLDTHFRFPEDDGSFARATLRCVGVGKCRRHARYGGTMCPSFKATREEMHSTRGRAHLLQEMMAGDPIRDLWRSSAVKEALDLCLACKGCKGDCPVNVDIATYKAEFLAHHYEGRFRPRAGYLMGRIHQWARLFAPVPWLPNAVMRAPGLGRLARRVAGIHPDRAVPAFRRPFRPAFRPAAGTPGRVPVILWTDTFNNHFSPEVLEAASTVLNATGHPVEITARNLCCGRPLYDYGWLDAAKRHLSGIMAALKPRLDAGACVVGVEASCLSVFRDELTNLFPGHDEARRLAERTLTLAEFLDRHGSDLPWPDIGRTAIVHGHCHHKAIMGMAADAAVLKRAGVAADVLDSGCCGMAGAFGYETEKYPVSMTIAEQVVLPAVRETDADLVIADGFSCREQINQALAGPGGRRRAVTLPEVLAQGLRSAGTGGGDRR